MTINNGKKVANVSLCRATVASPENWIALGGSFSAVGLKPTVLAKKKLDKNHDF